MASGARPDTFDDLLVVIAKRTKQDPETDELGRALNIPIHAIEGAQVENRHGITHMGTLHMLRDWRKGQHPSEEVNKLKDALKKAKMISTLSEVFPEAGAVNTSTAGSLMAGMTGPIDDLKLDEIGEGLGDDQMLRTLGLRLGFKESKVEMFLRTNRVDGIVSAKGTKNMLSAWRNKTPGADQVQVLRNALNQSNLGHIAETYLQ